MSSKGPASDDGLRGRVAGVSGPTVRAMGLEQVRLYDLVHVGERGLMGEAIRIGADGVTIQVYEETEGLRVGESVRSTGAPLTAMLGPGLLGRVYDGLQRPLSVLGDEVGPFIARGAAVEALDTETAWSFEPTVREGDRVKPGMVIGTVPETEGLEHRVLVPPGLGGEVEEIVEAGSYTISDVIARIRAEGRPDDDPVPVSMAQRWPIRRDRPRREKRSPVEPLITGTRVVDALFPVAKGGSAIIPGGFGTGKTVLEQTVARYAQADVVVYVGCGERGNEMAEVLEEFPELVDPWTGGPLMSRTVLIANTSNMPVAAREASIYLGVTLAEYYRDQGYDVVLLADSTSRWGEALREISSRLEELPAEEGFPAYLGARLSQFYERAGRVWCLGSDDEADPRSGSVTLVGAISPPGGDFSEPVTQHSLRIAGTFWALDQQLSRQRHFPAINWDRSYTLYQLAEWYDREVDEGWAADIDRALALLEEESELREIVQLVGPEALEARQRLILMVARMLREDFLQQSAFSDSDAFSPPEKTIAMLRVILAFWRSGIEALERGAALDDLADLEVREEVARMKELDMKDVEEAIDDLRERVRSKIDAIGRGGGGPAEAEATSRRAWEGRGEAERP